jgi:hypothetical protein
VSLRGSAATEAISQCKYGEIAALPLVARNDSITICSRLSYKSMVAKWVRSWSDGPSIASLNGQAPREQRDSREGQLSADSE